MMKHIKKFLTFLILGIGISLFSNNPAQAQALFIRGDINCDGVVDTVALRLFLRFLPSVNCTDRIDVNDKGEAATPSDSIYLANYLFFGGPPPPHPLPTCGVDAPADPLSWGFRCFWNLKNPC